eukprot:6735_1
MNCVQQNESIQKKLSMEYVLAWYNMISIQFYHLFYPTDSQLKQGQRMGHYGFIIRSMEQKYDHALHEDKYYTLLNMTTFPFVARNIFHVTKMGMAVATNQGIERKGYLWSMFWPNTDRSDEQMAQMCTNMDIKEYGDIEFTGLDFGKGVQKQKQKVEQGCNIFWKADKIFWTGAKKGSRSFHKYASDLKGAIDKIEKQIQEEKEGLKRATMIYPRSFEEKVWNAEKANDDADEENTNDDNKKKAMDVDVAQEQEQKDKKKGKARKRGRRGRGGGKQNTNRK